MPAKLHPDAFSFIYCIEVKVFKMFAMNHRNIFKLLSLEFITNNVLRIFYINHPLK